MEHNREEFITKLEIRLSIRRKGLQDLKVKVSTIKS